MCCLTVYKTSQNTLVFTHNRDEQWSRQVNGATVQKMIYENKKIWMPQDSLSFGTWIGSDGTRAAAILNGYKKNHTRKEKYRASRGTIIPQYLSKLDITQFLESFDPSGLEPFTLIMADNINRMTVMGWDEKDIYLHHQSTDQPSIFSSFTLYNDSVQEERKKIFLSYMASHSHEDEIWTFHEKKGDDHGKFIHVDYNKDISTVAITQIVLGEHSVIHYRSLLDTQPKHTIYLK